jgi:hypothetical protein
MKVRSMSGAIALVLAATLVPTQAVAQTSKTKVAGAIAIASGVGLMVAAFDYDASCPAGYTTHYFEGLETQCSYIGRTYTNIESQTVTTTFARPMLMWSGLGAVGAGVVLLMLPKRVQRYSPSVSVSPQGVTATKTIKF